MNIHSHLISVVLALAMTEKIQASPDQSLAEAARREAERRRDLEAQGISGKVIENDDPASLGRDGNLSVFSPAHRHGGASGAGSPRERGSPAGYRNNLERMDRAIRQTEERIAALRARMSAQRWALPKTGRVSRNSPTDSSERLNAQVLELEAKLKRLRYDRLRAYDRGLKAGFLPGELDGRGIIP